MEQKTKILNKDLYAHVVVVFFIEKKNEISSDTVFNNMTCKKYSPNYIILFPQLKVEEKARKLNHSIICIIIFYFIFFLS